MQYTILFVFALLFAGAFYLLFRKKPKLTEIDHFDDAWRTILLNEVEFYRDLDATEKTRFENSIEQFLEEILITGVEVEINDTDRLLVASSGVIPLFGYPGWKYRKLNEVLLYKDKFNHEYQTEGNERNVLGMVGGGAMNRMMILSRKGLYSAFRNKNSQHNVGIHEFVHLLDKADGEVDGTPTVLLEKAYIEPWIKLMQREIESIKAGHSDINPYGATNEAEFLSVISEYFFKQPHIFHKRHPELFNLLEKMYRQDLD